MNYIVGMAKIANSRFTSDGLEWFIPPCIAEMRLSDVYLEARNPSGRERGPRDFKLASFKSAGDGDAYVFCAGKEDCAGGKIKIDRHDMSQPKMPEATEAMAAICTSATMHVSDHGFVGTHLNLDSPHLPEDM
jgi:hypothetical protein